jgi:hypothetical protein
MSVTGAVLVLVAFGCLQTGKLDRHSRWFNLLNFVGSMMLGAVAVHDRRWGFIGLEFIWAAFSVPPLFHKKAARST